MTGPSVQGVARLLFGFITHGQPLESAAGDDRVALITQGLEVDIIRGTNQVAHVTTLGGHIGKIGALVSDGLEIHIAIVLVTAIAGAFSLETIVTLHAGKRRFRGHDLVFNPPVHIGGNPFVFAAVFHISGLHAVHKGLLPVTVLPVGRLVRLVSGEQIP